MYVVFFCKIDLCGIFCTRWSLKSHTCDLNRSGVKGHLGSMTFGLRFRKRSLYPYALMYLWELGTIILGYSYTFDLNRSGDKGHLWVIWVIDLWPIVIVSTCFDVLSWELHTMILRYTYNLNRMGSKVILGSLTFWYVIAKPGETHGSRTPCFFLHSLKYWLKLWFQTPNFDSFCSLV